MHQATNGLPKFLTDYEHFRAYLVEIFEHDNNVDTGDRFRAFCQRLSSFIPDFEPYTVAEESKKKSHDGGVDFYLHSPELGQSVYAESKFTITQKIDIDNIVSKFQSLDAAPASGTADLFDDANAPKHRFAVFAGSPISGILARYRESALSSRRFFDTLEADGRIEFIDGHRIFQIVRAAYEKAFSVPSELTLNFSDEWIKSDEVYLGFMDAKKLVDLYKAHGDALFFENIREFLGLASSKVREKRSVNSLIVQTASDEPELFLGRNNGITFKARNVNDTSRDALTLYNGSVVNGCQTTRCLALAAPKSHNFQNCKVQVKVVVSDEAWDVATAANYQNRIDQVDLEIARYLRPQLVRMHAAPSKVSIAGLDAEPTVEVIDQLYSAKLDYEEIRTYYIGLFSRSPRNMSDKNYTEVSSELMAEFAKFSVNEKLLFESLFSLITMSRDAMADIRENFAAEEFMAPFLRIFNDQKQVYRAYFSLLSACALTNYDPASKGADLGKAREDLESFLKEIQKVADTDRSTFTKALARAVVQFCTDARKEYDNDDAIRQRLASHVKGNFSNALESLRMIIAFEARY